MVVTKQGIVGSQKKISFIVNRFNNCINMLTGFFEILYKMELDLPLNFASLDHNIRYAILSELYRTYAIIYMGYAIV